MPELVKSPRFLKIPRIRFKSGIRNFIFYAKDTVKIIYLIKFLTEIVAEEHFSAVRDSVQELIFNEKMKMVTEE